MSNDVMADDPLYTALYRAIAAAKKAREELYAATSGQGCSMQLMRMSADIERRMAGDSIFDTHFEAELRELAKILAELGQGEQVTYYLHDEHGIIASMQMTRRSDWGDSLKAAQTALHRLADAVGDVHCHLAAERLAIAFRS